MQPRLLRNTKGADPKSCIFEPCQIHRLTQHKQPGVGGCALSRDHWLLDDENGGQLCLGVLIKETRDLEAAQRLFRPLSFRQRASPQHYSTTVRPAKITWREHSVVQHAVRDICLAYRMRVSAVPPCYNSNEAVLRVRCHSPSTPLGRRLRHVWTRLDSVAGTFPPPCHNVQ